MPRELLQGDDGLRLGPNLIQVRVSWPTFRAYLDGTYKSLRVQYQEDADRYMVWAVDGAVVYVCVLVRSPGDYPETFSDQAAIDAHDAERAEFEADYRPAGNATLQRVGPDGSVVVKQDPGTAETDPRYYAQREEFSTAGAQVFAAPAGVAPGKYLHKIAIQVLGAAFGDEIEVRFVSDGTVPAFGPDGTVLQSFGRVNAPLAGGVGWSAIRVEPAGVETAKCLLPGIRVEFVYHAAGVGARQIAVDWSVQE